MRINKRKNEMSKEEEVKKWAVIKYYHGRRMVLSEADEIS